MVYFTMFSEPTYLIGAGPNGVRFYDQIPDGVCTLALNGAATTRVWTGRIFGDANCYRYDYYYSKNPGELRIGLHGCGEDFNIHVDEDSAAFGSTVTGHALRWLQRQGVQSVILVGVDMYGGHWDNTLSGHEGEWPQRYRLQAIINELSASGMIIKSLSDTLLDVEVIDHAQELQCDTANTDCAS